MTSFSWLHLTDLHFGLHGQSSLWPRLRQKWWDDLARLHDECGPWDLILFTGDLVQAGSEEEFLRVDLLLNDLWNHLRALGSQPALLAVPGNHDLVRPPPGERVRLLIDWTPDVRDRFWKSPRSAHRTIVQRAFENYSNWWVRQARPNLRDGMLPGDFSTTIEKDGARLGVVGLNSTFLQLGAGDLQGRLALHVDQFHQACGGDGVAWAAQHHLCMLLTHHPPEWLNAESRNHLDSEVNEPGQFAVHLFGHMHESLYTVMARGGGEARRLWQGRSLFGLERFGDGSETRSHGYSAGSLRLDGDHAWLTFWPREARKLQDGSWKMVADQSFDLGFRNLHTEPKLVYLLNPYPVAAEVKESAALGRVREELRGGLTTRELRLLLAVTGDLAGSYSGELRQRAFDLADRIRRMIGGERDLSGFQREESALISPPHPR